MAEACPTSRRLAYTFADANIPGIPVVRANILHAGLDGQTVAVSGSGFDAELRLALVGRHNAENALGAWLAAESIADASVGVTRESVFDGLRSFAGAPGRLERIAAPSGASVFVDYAHTDDALRSVLAVLRPLTPKCLTVVFGCGGDRDRGKRPLMARAAEELADRRDRHLRQSADGKSGTDFRRHPRRFRAPGAGGVHPRPGDGDRGGGLGRGRGRRRARRRKRA
jgi:UDP-N-acetylmuramyl tripeptide synthase